MNDVVEPRAMDPNDPLQPVFAGVRERHQLKQMISTLFDSDLQNAFEQLLTIQNARIFGDYDRWEAASEKLGEIAEDSHIWSHAQAATQDYSMGPDE